MEEGSTKLLDRVKYSFLHRFNPPTPRQFSQKLCKRNLRWKLALAVALFTFGVFLLGISLFATLFLEFFIQKSISDFVVVDSEKHDRFDDWEDNTGADNVPLYVDEIRDSSSTKPKLEQVGPFSYRKYYKKINVTFLEDGDKVSYDRWTYYVYQHDRSIDNPNEVNVTSINTGYLGVMNSVGSESNLPTALTPREISQLKDIFTITFSRAIVAGKLVATQLPDSKQAVVDYIESSQNVTKKEADLIFYNEWISNTEIPAGSPWEVLGTLAQFSLNGSSITNESAQLLWDPMLPSLVNTEDEKLLDWDDPSDGARQNLTSTMKITSVQLDQVIQWRNSYRKREIEPGLLLKYNVSNLDELGFLQWGSAGVSNISIKEYVPVINLISIPEISIWSDVYCNTSVQFTVAESKKLLDMFSTTTGLQTFLFYFVNDMMTKINELYGINSEEADVMDKYISHIKRTFVNASVEKIFEEGGGLFTTRSAHEWIWGVEDPLLKALKVPNPIVSIMDNVSSIEEAEKNANVSLFHTGKDDLGKVARYIDWRGLGTLPTGTYWPVDIPIKGTTGYQFHPFIEENDDVIFFSEDLMRPFEVGFKKRITTRGIELYRYHPIPSDFDPNPDYNQFVYGFANMTMTYDIPFFLSQPNFLNVPLEYRNLVVGMNPDPKRDDTYVDIEPITGAVMDASKKLQVNMHIENETTPLNKYNANIPKGRFYPTLYIDETASINKKLADDFKSSVYAIINLRVGLFWSFFLAAIIVMLIGGVLFIYVLIKYHDKTIQFDLIREETPVFEDYDEGFTSSAS